MNRNPERNIYAVLYLREVKVYGYVPGTGILFIRGNFRADKFSRVFAENLNLREIALCSRSASARKFVRA